MQMSQSGIPQSVAPPPLMAMSTQPPSQAPTQVDDSMQNMQQQLAEHQHMVYTYNVNGLTYMYVFVYLPCCQSYEHASF
jgi:hypothetical protein